jgi:outer membrane protein OmpA-like peptidoglycan-associated protein
VPRELIGLFSIAIGLLLLAVSLFLGLRRAYARADASSGRGALVLLVYGFLFVIAGIVIERTPPVSRIAGKEEIPRQEIPETSVRVAPPSTDKEMSVTKDDEIALTSKVQTANRPPAKKTKRTKAQGELTPRAPFVPTPEDRVYIAVEEFLQKIENFFDHYGTPVTVEFSSATEMDMPPIFIEDTTADISAGYYSMLNRAARYIKEHPEFGVIEVQSHTNGEGPEVYNYLITQSRANMVRDYLIAQGVEPTRLVAKGYGTEKPYNSMANSTKYSHNRRIEFVPVSITQSVSK